MEEATLLRPQMSALNAVSGLWRSLGAAAELGCTLWLRGTPHHSWRHTAISGCLQSQVSSYEAR